MNVEPKSRSGRPPKFAEPRRPVTVTLPERTLRELELIHPDRARAIAKAASALAGDVSGVRPDVEEVELSPGQRLLVVGPSRYLQQVPGLHLVEISPGRHLLAFPSGMPVDTLEISIMDLIETVPAGQDRELRMLKHLLSIIRSSRRTRRVSKAEILFVHD